MTAPVLSSGAADCLFCKIVRGEIPCNKVYEDEHIFAFHDIHPKAPVHFMLIPKRHIATLYDVEETDRDSLAALLLKAGELARKQGLTEGFRLISNTGRVGQQEVYHLHVHVLGGPQPLGAMLPRQTPRPA